MSKVLTLIVVGICILFTLLLIYIDRSLNKHFEKRAQRLNQFEIECFKKTQNWDEWRACIRQKYFKCHQSGRCR